MQPRTSQTETLNHFKSLGKKGATISEVSDAFGIQLSSARSRVIRCWENGWLDAKEEDGPTGMRRRYSLNADGKAALRN